MRKGEVKSGNQVCPKQEIETSQDRMLCCLLSLTLSLYLKSSWKWKRTFLDLKQNVGVSFFGKMTGKWLLTQPVEQSLPTSEVFSSNPVIGKFYFKRLLSAVLKKTKIKKKENGNGNGNGPFWKNQWPLKRLQWYKHHNTWVRMKIQAKFIISSLYFKFNL